MRFVRLLSLLFACALSSAAFAQSANLVLDSVGPATPIGLSFGSTVPITFTNHGPGPATGVKLTFTIPPGATFQFVSAPAPLSCTAPEIGLRGDVVCTAASIDPTGKPLTVLVTMQITPAPGTTLTLTGVLTSSNNAQQSPQSASTTISQPLVAGLAIAGVTAPSTVYVGTAYDNVVTIENHGPGAALQAVVAVSFTNTLAKPPIAPPGWTCSVNSFLSYVSCSISSFPAGATATFTFPAYAQAPDQAAAAIGVSCSNPDPLSPFGSQTGTNTLIQMPPQTDLGISISADLPVVHTRDKQTYTVRVTNKGTSAAIWIRVDSQLPGKSISSDYDPNAYFVLDPGSTATSTYVRETDVTAAGPLAASVSVTAWNVAGARTAATTTSCVGPRIDDLQATLTAPSSLPPPVTPAVWTFGFVNNGPEATNGWDASITLAGTITSVMSSDPGVSCSIVQGSTAHCTGPDLASGGRMTAQITALPSGYFHPVTAKAFVFNPDADPHLENNTLSLETAPAPPGPDLSVEMKAAATTIAAGSTDNVRINVANIGSETLDGVTLVIPLAPAFTLAAPSSICTGTATLTCRLSDSSPGYTWPIDLKVRPTGTGTFNLTATVTTASTVPELRSDNNTGSVSITVLDPGARRRAARH